MKIDLKVAELRLEVIKFIGWICAGVMFFTLGSILVGIIIMMGHGFHWF